MASVNGGAYPQAAPPLSFPRNPPYPCGCVLVCVASSCPRPCAWLTTSQLPSCRPRGQQTENLQGGTAGTYKQYGMPLSSLCVQEPHDSSLQLNMMQTAAALPRRTMSWGAGSRWGCGLLMPQLSCRKLPTMRLPREHHQETSWKNIGIESERGREQQQRQRQRWQQRQCHRAYSIRLGAAVSEPAPSLDRFEPRSTSQQAATRWSARSAARQPRPRRLPF